MLIFRLALMLIIIFVSLVSSNVLAQGDILKYGESGTDFNIFGELNSRTDGYAGGNVGISLKGVIDLRFAITSSSEAKYSPSITIHTIKQDRTGLPFCLSFVYSVAAKDLSAISFDNNSSYGSVIFSNIELNQNKIIQPSFFIINQKNRYKHRLGLGPGLSYFYNFKTHETLKFEAALLFSDATTFLSISIGVLFRNTK